MPSTELVVQSNVEQRAKELTAEVKKIKSNLVNGLLYLGSLLSEARANEYPQVLGYESFGGWLDDSGLDMSERQAYYLIKVVDNAKFLGIETKQLEASKMSKLKEIFSLDPNEFGDKIKDLVAKSPDMKLDEIRYAVGNIRADGGLEPTSWFNLRVTESQKIMLQTALEDAQLVWGQRTLPDGTVLEATDATLLVDVICSHFVTCKDKHTEPPTIDAEFIEG